MRVHMYRVWRGARDLLESEDLMVGPRFGLTRSTTRPSTRAARASGAGGGGARRFFFFYSFPSFFIYIYIKIFFI